ncbi:hypothetical protein BDV41DRAFT_518679 [Aspergillus transmontanensis]|uniref:Uncharacterized protein n=1 Tax=Aspergillus transmontanensis TaxID=1034304 RepID=A0A5N6WG45_9EURO|nr:hypothetical protein BDV41DRAFT_518679 [Aspergillus transmontanensis]
MPVLVSTWIYWDEDQCGYIAITIMRVPFTYLNGVYRTYDKVHIRLSTRHITERK